MLEGKNISKSVSGQSILQGVNIEIKPSTITCIIGPTGSGKSTILNCLSLLVPPTEGHVIVDGQSFFFNGNSYKQQVFPYPKVTIVFQGLFLWPHLTNKENILLPVKDKRATQFKFEKLVNQLEIEHILNKNPNECSGGEKQRVAIARHILLEPKYLLLDEITSALDIEMVKKVADILLDLKQKGTGILLVTHMINFAKIVSDEFYFIESGVVVEAGKIELLNAPKTERLNKFLQIYN